ncbi:MAG TPA: response regulator, partial [Methylophaga aminisulfidivorans]|nr:response regulator [Methylophaga aminisulfidivorans]
EPSSMQLKLIMRHLNEEGVDKIDGASSGEEALKLIEKYPPDLLITSMYLPDMTASELLSTVHKDFADLSISCMLISSEKNHHALEPVKQTGVIAILPKPFNHADLQRAIKSTLGIVNPEEIALDNYDIDDISILIVDDSSTSRNHIARIFSSMGISNIDQVENGLEAVAQLQEKDYELIVTDLNMPEMDGNELVHHIRTEMNNTTTPIMMLTTENNEARLGEVEQAGVSAILNKPFDPTTIREMMHRLMRD